MLDALRRVRRRRRNPAHLTVPVTQRDLRVLRREARRHGSTEEEVARRMLRAMVDTVRTLDDPPPGPDRPPLPTGQYL